MPHLSTPDFIEKVIEEEETEILSPQDIERIIEKYGYLVKTEEGYWRLRNTIEEIALPAFIELIADQVKYYWEKEEQKPRYYREKVRDYLYLVFGDWEKEWTIRDIAEELDISESYAYYLRWLIRRAGFEV